ERRRDQRAETVVGQRPGRVLPRAAATEVASREQDLRALVPGLIEHEIRIERSLADVASGLAPIEIAPRVEQIRAEARARDRLQELLRDDDVGVDVGAIERRHQAGQSMKWLHGSNQYVLFWSAAFSIAVPVALMSLPAPPTLLQPAAAKVTATSETNVTSLLDMLAPSLNRVDERRRNALRSPRRPPSSDSPDACGRRGPAGPRNCGSRAKRSARRRPADHHSCPGTSSIPAGAIRSRPR